MPDYGVTPEGFRLKPFDVILADIVGRQRGTIDAGIDTSEHEVLGNANASIAMSIAEAWEAIQDVNDQLDPDAAEGASLDAVASLTATTRDGASYSRVLATVTLGAGGVLLDGTHQASVAGNPAARFAAEIEAGFIFSFAGGEYDVWFVAIEPGPVVANAETLTEIDTPIAGWLSITNDEDATLGSAIESDEAMRIRREEELAAQGGGTFDGMRGEILQVAGVTACSILENLSDVTDVNGLPPHSFEALVLGGDDDAIAAVIWKNKPLGIESYGSTVVDVEDSLGDEHVIRFSRPAEVRVYVAVNLLEVNEDTFGGNDAVREAIRSSAETPGQPGFLGIGVDVIARRLESAVLDKHDGVSGVIDLDIGVAIAAITLPSSGARSHAIGPREIATIDTGDVYVPEDI
jgi:uncharacterized phage protein gp47/JayE